MPIFISLLIGLLLFIQSFSLSMLSFEKYIFSDFNVSA
ncbi:hypothetical protein DLM_2842 [Aquitalea magnusonii]|uniref:Uncharacterized protein n=1 Tax=Aquitalea magnusonii TaxID=332411 RepID=A0A3G9GHX2_9NEIS|nr:hypothetical protein DLM_2842 [Aquitalea magnusonii]